MYTTGENNIVCFLQKAYCVQYTKNMYAIGEKCYTV